MANKRPGGARNEMIHCEFCGEDYAATYKRCPFCDGRPHEEGEDGEEGGRRAGGRRLATNTRGGGYGGSSTSPLRIVGTVVSLAFIVAAVCIVVSQIIPLVNKGHTQTIDPDATATPSAAVEPSQAQTSESPDPSADPSVSPSSVPDGQTATGFTLSYTEFTMNDNYPDPVTIAVTFVPAGSTGTITWSSSDPDVASVDENGKVTHGSKQGSATITATMGDGTTQECLVRNSVSSSSAGGSSTGGQTGGSLSLNKTDFSFITKDDPAVQMKVNGTSSTPTWSIGNTSVATISADGVVRPVGSGTTTITCTVDGQTLTCIVRCQF